MGSGELGQLIYGLKNEENTNMTEKRVLNGYSKDEQKELENAKKYMDCSDLLHIITDFISGTRFNLIWEKYNEAEPDEQISIIRDILDFYTDKAKFAGPKKYYVKLIRNNDSSYLNRSTSNGFCMACCYQPDEVFQTEFTEQEIEAIDPRYKQFAIPVEDE
jgi:Protein of unknown function (DUF1642).